MISDEKHEHFLNTLDDKIKTLLGDDIISDEKDNLEFCMNRFNEIRFGEQYPIVWVKDASSPVKEFYSSDLTLNWLVTYMEYHVNVINGFQHDTIDNELSAIYSACLYMCFVMKYSKGVNTVDGVTYILQKDCEFVQYKMDKKLFI